MWLKRLFSVGCLLLSGGALTGCCLFSGAPIVTISGPTSATVGEPVSFTATAFGGTPPYTFLWSFGATGQSVTYTFNVAGQQKIGVMVTDSCGRTASAIHTVEVSENLTGRWIGTISRIWGWTTQLEMQLRQVGVTVTANVFVGGSPTIGNGSFANGQFQLSFQWPGSTVGVTLVGSYNPFADELSGEWYVGGQLYGTWRVRR